MKILYASSLCVQCQRHVWQERAPLCQLSSHPIETAQKKTKDTLINFCVWHCWYLEKRLCLVSIIFKIQLDLLRKVPNTNVSIIISNEIKDFPLGCSENQQHDDFSLDFKIIRTTQFVTLWIFLIFIPRSITVMCQSKSPNSKSLERVYALHVGFWK